MMRNSASLVRYICSQAKLLTTMTRANRTKVRQKRLSLAFWGESNALVSSSFMLVLMITFAHLEQRRNPHPKRFE